MLSEKANKVWKGHPIWNPTLQKNGDWLSGENPTLLVIAFRWAFWFEPWLKQLVVRSWKVSTSWKLILACLGSLLAGYASVSLLDNIVCMACSVSFPRNRAAVVGYLKAVLATAGGLWALLWVQVFKDRYGLLAFMAISAIASFAVGVLSLSSMKVLPNHCRERVQSQGGLDLNIFWVLVSNTSWKINMEHTNHPFRKENDHPSLYDSMIMFHVNLPGCIFCYFHHPV